MTISLLFRVLCCIWFASEVTVAVATRTQSGKGNVRDRGSILILWIVITAGITGCEWLSAVVRAPLFGGAPWLRLASLLALLTGIVIRWTAILTLGKAFSANLAIREEQKLKQRGLYRSVRHPSYSGLLLILLAVGLHSRNWAGLLVMIVPTAAALIYRIHVEEAALSEACGEQYADLQQGHLALDARVVLTRSSSGVASGTPGYSCVLVGAAGSRWTVALYGKGRRVLEER